MIKAFEIAKLVWKSLRGELSDEEQKTLQQWRSASSANEDAFRRMTSDDFYEKTVERWADFDERLAYERFLRRKTRYRETRRLWRRVGSVAAIVLPLVFAVVLYREMEERDAVIETEVARIVPGTSKAKLMLADGRIIELGERGVDSTIVTRGSRIDASGSGLVYTKKDGEVKLEYNELLIPRGGEFCLTLSDSTRVWLNSSTTIRYPEVFGKEERRVFVEGEAFFEVKKDARRPFVVEFARSEVTVLGTSFNVRAYPDEGHSLTTLAEGSVRVETGGQELRLKPGEQVEVDGISGNMVKRVVDVENYTSWKDGRFVFVRQSLEDILRTLARWYNIQVVFRDEGAKQVSLSGNLRRYDDFSSVADMLQMTGDVRFVLNGNEVYVSLE